jgi:adenine-specific DNA-methyltransferase
MEFRIADTFTESLAQLTGEGQKALKTPPKAEINEDAWATLNSDTSRPFDKPRAGRIAVKVINHLGDEVMKVFKVHERS